MSRVSKYKVDKQVEDEMFHLFWASMTKLQNPREVSAFLSDLLTDNEEIMLAKRFAVAVLLLRGKRPVDITNTLHVTYTTIGSVAAWVKNAKPHTRRVLERIIGSQDWRVMLDRIDALLDELPPRWGSDWTRAGKEKWQRKTERASHQALR